MKKCFRWGARNEWRDAMNGQTKDHSNDLLSALQRVAKAAMFLTAPCCATHAQEGAKELNEALSVFTDDSFSALKGY